MNRTSKMGLALVGATAAITTMVPAAPAQAFTASNSASVGGVTYSAYAYSCNLYWSSCSWNTNAKTTRTMTFTHTSDVKANGINVTLNVSKSPGATISGNNTSLVSQKKSVYGTASYMSGTASPSIFSVSVAARSKLSSSSGYVATGWTTW